MRCLLATLALSLSLSVNAWAQAPAADSGDDAGTLDEQMAEIESTRGELEKLTRELDSQRQELERQNEQARAEQNLKFAVTGVVVLVLCGAGVAWIVRRNKRRIARK